MAALAVVVGLAVLREGSEVVLFLYGIVATGPSASALLLGGALGVAAGAAFTALTYYGLIQHSAAHISRCDRADCVAGRGHGGAGGSVPRCRGVIHVLGQRLVDSSAGCHRTGHRPPAAHVGGLHDRPTELQLAAYLGTLAAMAALTWTVGRSPSPAEDARQFASSMPVAEPVLAGELQIVRPAPDPTAKDRESNVGRLVDHLERARAGPRGERLPCSQLRTVSTGTPMRAANSAFSSLVRARTPRA